MKCFLPYTEMSIWLKENSFLYSPCCKIKPKSTKDYNISIKDFNNLEFVNEIKQGLHSKDKNKPKQCNYCWNSEEKGLESWRNLQGEVPEKWKNNLELLYNSERRNLVNFVKIALDQTCDSGCVYCSPHNSSLWYTEIQNNLEIAKQVLQEDDRYIDPIISTTLSKKSYLFIHSYLKYLGSKIHLYENFMNIAFLGGEPFLSPFLRDGKFIEYIDSFYADCPKDFSLIYEFNTNVNTPKQIIDKNLKIIEQSKKKYINSQPKIILSGEAYGSALEYIRYGTTWNLYKENSEKYISKSWLQIGVMLSLNVFCIPSLHKHLECLLQFAKQYNHKISIVCGTVYYPNAMHPAVLENNTTNINYLNQCLNIIEKYKNYIIEDRIESLVNKIQSLKNELGTRVDQKPKLQNYIRYIEQVRNQKIKDYIPELSYLGE